MPMFGTATDDAGDNVEFVFPRDLFEAEQDSSTVFWTCVRVRPRCEKKLCRMDPPFQNSPTRLRQNSPTCLFSDDHG
jgi:hypothetical protein